MLHSSRDCFGITRHRFSPRGHPSCGLALSSVHSLRRSKSRLFRKTSADAKVSVGSRLAKSAALYVVGVVPRLVLVGSKIVGKHFCKAFHADLGKAGGYIFIAVVDPHGTVVFVHIGMHVPEDFLFDGQDAGGVGDCRDTRRRTHISLLAFWRWNSE